MGVKQKVLYRRDSDELAITSILSIGEQKWMQRLESLVTVTAKSPKKV